MSKTKDRILIIAGDLFASQGYTGTSIADIAGELGTTTAALYYHFRSKAEILSALIAAPMADYNRIVEELHSRTTPEELLGAFVDLTVDSRALAAVIDRDPSVLALIDEQLPKKSERMTAQVINRLAGPDADRAAVVRAYAALALIKGATQAVLANPDQGVEACADADPCAESVSAAVPARSVASAGSEALEGLGRSVGSAGSTGRKTSATSCKAGTGETTVLTAADRTEIVQAALRVLKVGQ
jgi:AcrR family transcriptional regulator